MDVTITLEQAEALAAWANDNHPGGTTAWGPRFSAAMDVAHAVRDKLAEPVDQKPAVALTGADLKTELNDMWQRAGVATCELLEKLLTAQGETRAAAIVSTVKQELLDQ